VVRQINVTREREEVEEEEEGGGGRRREDQSWWIMEGVGRSKFDGDTVRRLKETIFTAAIIRTSDLIRAFVSFCFYYYR
jgi:hypothetical protein